MADAKTPSQPQAATNSQQPIVVNLIQPDNASDSMVDAKTPSQPQAATNSQQPIVVNLIQPDNASEGARQMAAGRALNMDTTVPMGKYLVNGVLVNANGAPLKEKD